jgi:hypothetical protein
MMVGTRGNGAGDRDKALIAKRRSRVLQSGRTQKKKKKKKKKDRTWQKF